jgi:hypothetical protein
VDPQGTEMVARFDAVIALANQRLTEDMPDPRRRLYRAIAVAFENYRQSFLEGPRTVGSNIDLGAVRALSDFEPLHDREMRQAVAAAERFYKTGR